jgi:hypothetical protein
VLVSRSGQWLVRTPHATLTPANRVRLIVRTEPGTDRLALSETGLPFRDALRAAALEFREVMNKAAVGEKPGKKK